MAQKSRAATETTSHRSGPHIPNPNPEVVTTLLDTGSNIEAVDFMGRTPLMIAAEADPNPEVIIVLLKAGADAKARDKAGKTAFDYAKTNYYLRVRGVDALRKLQEASQKVQA